MSLSEQARELAGKIDKATPGPWIPWGRFGQEISKAWTNDEGDISDRQVIATVKYDSGMDGDGREGNVSAIVAARNEAPALLRQLADENERLRRAGKIMATAIWYRHDTPESTMVANEFLNDPTTKEAQ